MATAVRAGSLSTTDGSRYEPAQLVPSSICVSRLRRCDGSRVAAVEPGTAVRRPVPLVRRRHGRFHPAPAVRLRLQLDRRSLLLCFLYRAPAAVLDGRLLQPAHGQSPPRRMNKPDLPFGFCWTCGRRVRSELRTGLIPLFCPSCQSRTPTPRRNHGTEEKGTRKKRSSSR